MDDKTKDLLEECREALAPQYQSSNEHRDTEECNACGAWEYIPNPSHPGRCDDYCRGSHERRDIVHRPGCLYVRLGELLK